MDVALLSQDQRLQLYSIKGHLPSKIVFHQSLSSIKGLLPCCGGGGQKAFYSFALVQTLDLGLEAWTKLNNRHDLMVIVVLYHILGDPPEVHPARLILEDPSGLLHDPNFQSEISSLNIQPVWGLSDLQLKRNIFFVS